MPGVKAREEAPVRLFESNFLEFFTHINPLVVLAVWVPVVSFFLLRSAQLRPAGGGWLFLPLAWLGGLLLWSPAEYLLHRFVFHFHPKNPGERVKRLLFLAHGVHHAQPRSKTRLVMPPVLSIPLSLIFLGIFHGIVTLWLRAPQVTAGLFAGFITGYILYDMSHYSIHHFQMRKGYFKRIRQHHMGHHFKTPEQRFGVTSLFWDRVFGTDPAD